ncbi:hypothetical protein [Flammeovirga sp. SJP92]|uniref:hypothetical protein n=1 Tax=Flammeovirga sp. SJP92 TaxID=1775430 RepID=UPI0007895BC2|nr:hypothetical protein [Flammeovirga sp. SJP92]KXX71481.1 hypothetical protein AVL50_06145 [Flammeovirga sp. SJP92]
MTVNTLQKYTIGYAAQKEDVSKYWLDNISEDSLQIGAVYTDQLINSEQELNISTAFKESHKPQLALKNAAKVIKENTGDHYALVYIKDRRMWHTRSGNIRVFVFRQGRFLSPPHHKATSVSTPFLLKEEDQLILASSTLLFDNDPKILKEIFHSSLPQEIAEKLLSTGTPAGENSICTILPCEFLRDNTPSRDRMKVLEEVFPFEKEAEQRLANPNQQRNTIYNFAGFVLFTLLVIFMYNKNKTNWKGELDVKQQEIAQLQKALNKANDKIHSYDNYQKLHTQSIAERNFDAFDSERYRMYALFRDVRNKFDRNQVAEKFNIYNPLAIETKVVMGENWFIVPVKGTHLVQKGETLKKIASLYYDNPKEGIQLIQQFNPQVVEGHSIFLPFEMEK